MLALGEPMISRSPLANVLLRDGDGVPGTHTLDEAAERCRRGVEGHAQAISPTRARPHPRWLTASGMGQRGDGKQPAPDRGPMSSRPDNDHYVNDAGKSVGRPLAVGQHADGHDADARRGLARLRGALQHAHRVPASQAKACAAAATTCSCGTSRRCCAMLQRCPEGVVELAVSVASEHVGQRLVALRARPGGTGVYTIDRLLGRADHDQLRKASTRLSRARCSRPRTASSEMSTIATTSR